ncbi:hypothetical protein MLD38_035304 [Melastoma candidum]|uniref:Uncharacterized protein n=1 Tax=Melastoma candidum TaxID=119954 RepID=A0ACB9ME97_9MYRT|nr:hypothetical protein MLD38_035304 [Melastoma candidum]
MSPEMRAPKAAAVSLEWGIHLRVLDLLIARASNGRSHLDLLWVRRGVFWFVKATWSAGWVSRASGLRQAIYAGLWGGAPSAAGSRDGGGLRWESSSGRHSHGDETGRLLGRGRVEAPGCGAWKVRRGLEEGRLRREGLRFWAPVGTPRARPKLRRSGMSSRGVKSVAAVLSLDALEDWVAVLRALWCRELSWVAGIGKVGRPLWGARC